MGRPLEVAEGRVNVLGVGVDPLTVEDLHAELGSSVDLLLTRPPGDPTAMLAELEFCCDALTRRDRLVRLWWD